MRIRHLKSAMQLGILLVLWTPSFTAHAEWFADVSIGTAFTHSSDVEVTPPVSGLSVLREVGYDKSFTIGGRLGYWLEPVRLLRMPMPVNFGLAMSLFKFSPDVTSQAVPGTVLSSFTEIDVTAVSLDLMVRLPMMVNEHFPIGRLRPYATIGPALFWSTIKGGNFGGESATDASLGLKLGLGVAYAIRPAVDLFGEYRYTHFGIDADTIGGGLGGSTSRAAMDINTSHLVGGLAFRF
jgi:opacity protein-like surface antigen